LACEDDLALKTPGVYSVPCECGNVYIGQNGCFTEIRVKEHQHHTCLEQPDKSAVSEYSTNLGQCIQLQDTTILSTKPRHMDNMIREAIETELHLKSMSRENGLRLSWSWEPLIHSLKGSRKHKL
jgi:predicted GIY-YIG superfamily endonuclease